MLQAILCARAENFSSLLELGRLVRYGRSENFLPWRYSSLALAATWQLVTWKLDNWPTTVCIIPEPIRRQLAVLPNDFPNTMLIIQSGKAWTGLVVLARHGGKRH